jgi:hypothetical protein
MIKGVILLADFWLRSVIIFSFLFQNKKKCPIATGMPWASARVPISL